MFLRHARTTRLAAAYLLFTVALVMVPKADIPETLFDEADTSTNEMVVEKAASSWEYRQSVTAFVQEYLPSRGGSVSAEFCRFTQAG